MEIDKYDVDKAKSNSHLQRSLCSEQELLISNSIFQLTATNLPVGIYDPTTIILSTVFP